MSFFSELSVIAKGAIIFAVVVLGYFGIASAIGIFPFGNTVDGVQTQRGVNP